MIISQEMLAALLQEHSLRPSSQNLRKHLRRDSATGEVTLHIRVTIQLTVFFYNRII